MKQNSANLICPTESIWCFSFGTLRKQIPEIYRGLVRIIITQFVRKQIRLANSGT